MRWDRLALVTDFYELTMMCGYYECGRSECRAVFDLYFRNLPFGGGFCVAAGLEPACRYLTGLRFSHEEIDYLRGLNTFPERFLRWLEDFRFRGDLWGLPEGTPVFPGEPLLRVHATLAEAQLVESALLNTVNFQTLIATKAARACLAAGDTSVVEFGLRRAQGLDGALSAARAAYLGGCAATSNTLAGKLYGIPVRGTQAHSWIMSFPDELSAFRAYAEVFPEACVLLVDTYDTLESGIPNAIRVGRELEARGHRLAGIRLDSGDLAYLSKEARRRLDEAGFTETRIVASNELDEWLISDLRSQGAKIDVWGVGTHLVTGKDQPALGGVYKLVAIEERGELAPRIKISANPEKTTLPGVKQIWRATDESGRLLGDVLALEEEDLRSRESLRTHHPFYDHQTRVLRPCNWEPLLVPVLRRGEPCYAHPDLAAIRERTLENLRRMRPENLRLTRPDPYWVGLTPDLFRLRRRLVEEARGRSPGAR